MVNSTTISYEAQTMCKTRFDSQGMILNGFYKKTFLEKRRQWHARPPPSFMANAIKNFYNFFKTSLSAKKHSAPNLILDSAL